ncbi:MAG: hypothetical protein ACW98Y_20435 [Candidatus Thorarchaeota archaeon]|jgi:hypothetical protein
MSNPDDNAARLTLKIAGVFQEVRDEWVRRLESYYSQLESLIEGQWISHGDMRGVIQEAKVAAREALDGLGTDLSSELVHESRGVFGRFEFERQSLIEEISDLRSSLSLANSGDEGLMRKENEALRHALLRVPEFHILESLRTIGRGSYDALVATSGQKKSLVRRHCKKLVELGYIAINKKSRPHQIVFISAPWRSNQASSSDRTESPQLQISTVSH